MSHFLSEVIFRWGVRCFGDDYMYDRKVRALRLLEEAVELCQAVEIDRAQAVRTVDVVYERAPGDEQQELGGVLVCAHAYAVARGWDADGVTEREVHRCLSKSPEHFASRNSEKLALGLTGTHTSKG